MSALGNKKLKLNMAGAGAGDLKIQSEDYLTKINKNVQNRKQKERVKKALQIAIGTVGLATAFVVPIVIYDTTKPIVVTISTSTRKKEKFQKFRAQNAKQGKYCNNY